MRAMCSGLIALGTTVMLATAPVLAADYGKSGQDSASERGKEMRADPQEMRKEAPAPGQPAAKRAPAAERAATGAKDVPKGSQHVVREGETLGDIAERELGSRDRWREIARANGISDPSRLRVGQKLSIPSPESR